MPEQSTTAAKPVKYIIQDHLEETECDHCGAPILIGQEAYEVEDEGHHIYCSRRCAAR